MTRRRSSPHVFDPTSPRTLGCAAVLLLLVLAPAGAQPPLRTVPPDPGFVIIGEYHLELDGSVDEDATIYHSPRRGSILVRSDDLDYALELRPRDRSILAWPKDQIAVDDDGTVEVRGEAKPAGRFELVDNFPVFTLGGKKIRFVSRPPVLGTYDAAALKKAFPVYAQRARIFEPQAFYLEKLEDLDEELHIRVFFGTWCDVCTQMLPRILRTEEALAELGAPITFEYHGIPADFGDPEAKRLNVTGLPTGILYFEGKELGRIVGHGWSHPTMAIHNQLLRPHDQTLPVPNP